MAQPALQAEDLRRVYELGEERVLAVDGVSFSLERGEFVALMGPSGSGKSTLLAMLCGLERPSGGRVLIDGVDLGALSEDERARLRRRKVGFVFQTFNLIPVLSLLENAGLPQLLDGAPASVWRPKAEAALARVGLAHRKDHLPDQASVGEQQRAALARVLAAGPSLLLADEPTGALDSQRGHDVLALLREAARDLGAAVLMVTHDANAAAVADRVLHLRDGRLEDGGFAR